VDLTADVRSTFTAPGAEPFTVDASLEVAAGETVVVLGPSGSGKSLLLESVAGFHAHDGVVTHGDREVTDAPPEARDFGFVFQDYALFPHMTVAENVRYGDRYHDETADAEALLADLGIADLADRYPKTLSGGEKQRAALARALYVEPSVLLLDEPLSSLDVPTRDRLRRDMLDVLDGVTSLYVTHDRTTARTLADRILLIDDGEVVQRGTPQEVFDHPTSPFVARFTGSNCVPLDADGIREAVGAPADAEWLAVRPEDVRLGGGGSHLDGETSIDDNVAVDASAPADGTTGTVERVVREDATYRVTLSVGNERLEVTTNDPPAVDSVVGVSFDGDSTTVL
jgi:ABC-type Fe3+/spermidine/putrescine transport system ATPase subunit